MYFDPRPKTKKEDLYNREKELEQFFKAISYSPLIVVTGLRRTGKTSFVNVALVECGCPFAILDLRGLPFNPSYADVVRRLEAAFRQIDRKWFSDLSEALKHLKGVSILGNELSFEWGKAGVDFAELFGEIDRWAVKMKRKFLIAFDEIQVIRGDKWMLRFLAHVVDSYHNVVVVVTGSEVGVLFDFLGFDQPSSPLYGRHFVQVQMKNFSASMAKDFLVSGFKQIKLEPSAELLEYAVKRLDGVPGWLTLFGVRCRDRNACSKELVDEVASEAGKLAREEVLKVVALSRRYGATLNFLAKIGAASWSQIKSVIETKEARSITNHAVTTVLRNLCNMGIIMGIDNKYVISDVLLIEGIRQEPLPE
ncbi:MAG: ATP-binding protein [Candidatus Bathyarchaeia archaeon]